MHPKLARLIKYNQCLFENLEHGKKNFLGEPLRPAMCKTCTNVLGKDVGRLSNGVCEACNAPALTRYGDETERIIHNNMGLGKTRDAYIERHRAQKGAFLKSHPNVVSGWKPTNYE